jgi:hypothetical protein
MRDKNQFWSSAFPIFVTVKIVYKPIRHLDCVVVLNMFCILMLTGRCSLSLSSSLQLHILIILIYSAMVENTSITVN